jgi:hypothetical protein
MFRALVALLILIALAACKPSESDGIYEADAKVVAALRDAGSDLSKPHPIDFYFYGFADRASAERLGQELNRPGWKIDVHQTPDTTEWTVVASAVMIPDARAISNLGARFETQARRFGGAYDGWEAAVTR